MTRERERLRRLAYWWLEIYPEPRIGTGKPLDCYYPARSMARHLEPIMLSEEDLKICDESVGEKTEANGSMTLQRIAALHTI